MFHYYFCVIIRKKMRSFKNKAERLLLRMVPRAIRDDLLVLHMLYQVCHKNFTLSTLFFCRN